MPRIKIITAILLVLASGLVSADVSSLCEKTENIVWSCEFKKKVYSICSSKVLTESNGYLQYRAGTAKNIEFKYPELLQYPKDKFQYGLLAHGAMLIFKNGSYSYQISEPLIGQPEISVEKDGNGSSYFQCKNSTQSLTKNETMEIFRVIGAYK
jgi:hypothetical protein